ncbi:MAG: alanine racemase [Oscillospiraceae bacterium]|nr:alanine racemase [Oscillospiraceae bacterium]
MSVSEYNSYLSVDTAILRENVRRILEKVPQLIPVIKDDAYGLGLVPIAGILCGFEEIRTLAVAHVSEGLALRRAGIDREVLVMGGVLPFQEAALVEAGLTAAVSRPGMVTELAALAREQGRRCRVQIKIDTGLHRIGLAVEELDGLIRELDTAGEWVEITGAFSHFSAAEDLARDTEEYGLFLAGVRKLESAGFSIPLRHMACSATSEYWQQFDLDAVRCGRRMYMDNPIRPDGTVTECVSWRSYITHIAHRRAGERIGYGSGRILLRDSVIATLGVGYGDGLNQALFAVDGPVLIGGQRCTLLSCCMDQCMADVTGVDCAVGDEATFFGTDGRGNFLSAQEVASLVGGDEGCGLTSALSPRVARLYI